MEGRTAIEDQVDKVFTSSIADSIDEQLYEPAISCHAAATTTLFSVQERSNISTASAGLNHSVLTDLDPEAPSLSRDLAAAGVSQGGGAIFGGAIFGGPGNAAKRSGRGLGAVELLAWERFRQGDDDNYDEADH